MLGLYVCYTDNYLSNRLYMVYLYYKKEIIRRWWNYGVTHISEEFKLLKSMFDFRVAEYKAREGKRFDRKEAARRTGLSLSHLSGVFNGKQFTSTENLFIIAKMLGCKVDDLYNYEEE